MMLRVLCVAAAGLLAGSTPAVKISYRHSACLQRPFDGTGKVRFLIRLVNTSARTATFPDDIHVLWLRPDGWKDSWLNVIDGGSLSVPARKGKTYYVDFGADPTKRSLRCALRIGSSDTVHYVRVIR